MPHTRIDTEAHWTKSGWHGWVYGWKLHLCCSAGDVWIPLAADLEDRQFPIDTARLSGGVAGAKAGTLTVMCGGDAAVLERARPAIEAFLDRAAKRWRTRDT